MVWLASLRSPRPRAIRWILPAAVGVMLAVWLSLTAAAPADTRSAWHTVGSATLQDGRLVLTESVRGAAGAAWQVPAVKVPPKFKAAFDFALSDSVGAADGFAFVIQGASVDALGRGGQGLGYWGIPNSVAVEFDTYPNYPGPAVPHISIHTRGPLPNEVDEQYSLGSTVVPFLSDGARHSVKIRYRRQTLSVRLDGQPKLSVPINIAERLELRGRCVWFGFTAATGSFTQRHEILSYRLKRGGGRHKMRDGEKEGFSARVRSERENSECEDSPKVKDDPPSEDKADSRSDDEEDSRSDDEENSRSEDDEDSPTDDDEDSPTHDDDE